MFDDGWLVPKSEKLHIEKAGKLHFEKPRLL
jgi:hypothetical protein